MATPRTPKPGAGQTPPIEDAEVVQDEPATAVPDPAEAQTPPVEERAEDTPLPEPALFEEVTPAPEPPPSVETDRPEAVQSEPPPPRRASPVPLVIGGVVAAAFGFGLAQVVPGGWPMAGTDVLQARIAAQEASLQSLASDLAAARAEVAALPTPVAPDLSGIEGRLAALDATLAELSSRPVTADPASRLAALESRIATLETLPAGTGEGGGDPAAMAALLREVSVLRTEVEAQKAEQARFAAELAAEAETVRQSIAAAEAEAARLTAEAEAAAQRALLRTAAGRVLAALENGTSFAQPVDELVAGGVPVPEVLAASSAGMPTLSALQEAFADPARAALEASLRADMGEGALERLGTFLRSTTGARSLTPREGSDPDAILSRAEGHLRAGDIAASLAELATLPEEGKAAMADWVATATRRLAAQEAAAELLAQVEG